MHLLHADGSEADNSYANGERLSPLGAPPALSAALENPWHSG
jgi:hypothetical protein